MSTTNPPAGPVSLCRPDWLYQVVVDYAGFGAHLTGTDADRSTAGWLTKLISEIGGTATLEPFAFDRFDVGAELVADARAVPSVPLCYSATGSFDTDDVQVVRFGASDRRHDPADWMDARCGRARHRARSRPRCGRGAVKRVLRALLGVQRT